MVAHCGAGALLYVTGMLLGRTYDMRTDSVGIDIFDRKYIEEATNNPIHHPQVQSKYMLITQANDKRDFLGITGELAMKVSSGLVDIRGAGEYLKDNSNFNKSLEILVHLLYGTDIQEMSPDAKPIEGFESIQPEFSGTHVVTGFKYGGELYASIQFIAKKLSDLEEIKAQVIGSISKSGAFDLDAQGKLEKVASNLTNKATMSIDYYSTVPLEDVPTTIEGVQVLTNKFKDLVQKVKNGIGVVVCANLRPLSDFSDKFTFTRNSELNDALEDFSYKFENLRNAKAILLSFINDLPDEVPEEFLKKLMDFYARLKRTINSFFEVIANLNVEKGSSQLSPADAAFDQNSKIRGNNRFTKEIKIIISQYPGSGNYTKPRGMFVNWGKRSCDNQASNIVYIGYSSIGPEVGIGAGSSYQCLPENPDFKTNFDISGLNSKTSQLAAVRYTNMSMYKNSKRLQDNVVPCAVCETPMRPTTSMFPGRGLCPGNWVTEYTGYIASSGHNRLRSQYVCINKDPDTYKTAQVTHGDPLLYPVKMGNRGNENYRKQASIPCAVCSK